MIVVLWCVIYAIALVSGGVLAWLLTEGDPDA